MSPTCFEPQGKEKIVLFNTDGNVPGMIVMV